MDQYGLRHRRNVHEETDQGLGISRNIGTIPK